MTKPATEGAIHGPLVDLYDVFVDWPGRLRRELPGIEAHLQRAGARRVLDAGCGTGRHVAALRAGGYVAHGADASPDMLASAAEHLAGSDGLHSWRMGEAPPATLVAAAPFDAVIAMGNVWPLLAREGEAERAVAAWRTLVRPGGLLLLGLKAFAVRRAAGEPYLPLLRREHAGRVHWFVRFVDFALSAGEDGEARCDLHMVVVAGAAEDPAPETRLHRVTRVRAWDPEELARWLAARGLSAVRVSGSLDEPSTPPRGEDVYLDARFP